MNEEETLWRQWLGKSERTQLGALSLIEVDKDSAVSRFYYTVYQAATALLHYRGGHPPPMMGEVRRESWTHEDTPILVENVLEKLLQKRDRDKIARYLKELYRFRIYADYSGSQRVSEGELNQIRKMSNWVVKIAQEVMTDGRKRD